MEGIKKIFNWKIAIFSLILLFILPRGVFVNGYREIVISGENIQPNSDVINLVPLGMRFEIPNRKKIENSDDRYILNKKIPEHYLVILRNTLSPNEKVKIQIKENGDYREIVRTENIKEGVPEQHFLIKGDDIVKKSPLNYGKYLLAYLLIYFLNFFLMKQFFKELKIKGENISIILFSIIFFSVANNSNQVVRGYSVLFTFTFFYFIKKYIIEKKDFKNNLVFLCIGTIPIFIVLSEYNNLKKYEDSFTNYFYSFFIIGIFLIYDYKRSQIKSILEFLYIASFISGIVNMVSPLIFSGIYSFTFAITMVYLLLYSLDKFLDYEEYKDKRMLFIYFIGVISGVYNVIYGGRRTTYVAIGLSVIIRLVWELLRRRYKIFLKISLFLTSILYVVYKYNPFGIMAIAKSILDENNYSNQQRLFMWRKSLYMLKENHVRGIGSKNFYNEAIKEKYVAVKKIGEAFTPDFIHAHNEYLEQVVSKGLAFFIIYFVLIYKLIINLIKSKDGFYWMMVSALGIYGIFEPFSLRDEAIVAWSIIGAIILNEKEE
ncbi:MAG: O-antigen ligase family protein, partial [Cetobacterium sp.]